MENSVFWMGAGGPCTLLSRRPRQAPAKAISLPKATAYALSMVAWEAVNLFLFFLQNYNPSLTVEPPIKDPPRKGQPLIKDTL